MSRESQAVACGDMTCLNLMVEVLLNAPFDLTFEKGDEDRAILHLMESGRFRAAEVSRLLDSAIEGARAANASARVCRRRAYA